jgi:diguanylate cyclase (GGDEF)-like protein
MKILVVDDSATIRAGLRIQLTRMQHEVLEAENGERALEMWGAQRPDLVLIDVMMPVMDGYEAARRMRAAGQDDWAPIIFLSSMEADQDLERAIEAGGDDYLVKPVSAVVLSAKIRAMHRLETMRRRLLEVSRELAASNRQLEMLSRQDGLTGLANRRYFDAYLATEIRRASRSGEPLSLILIDIDYFKLYNDAYGHQGGDECLKRVAGCMQAVCQRAADLAARYGGEEFVLVLPNTAPEGARIVANSLAAAIAALEITHVGSKVNDFLTLSQGIATLLPGTELGPDILIEHADQALYRAKERGRNRAEMHGETTAQGPMDLTAAGLPGDAPMQATVQAPANASMHSSPSSPANLSAGLPETAPAGTPPGTGAGGTMQTGAGTVTGKAGT